jgi:hypothetical protein
MPDSTDSTAYMAGYRNRSDKLTGTAADTVQTQTGNQRFESFLAICKIPDGLHSVKLAKSDPQRKTAADSMCAATSIGRSPYDILTLGHRAVDTGATAIYTGHVFAPDAVKRTAFGIGVWSGVGRLLAAALIPRLHRCMS